MSPQALFSVTVLMLTGAGGLAVHPASAQSLYGNQVVGSSSSGSYTFHQNQCANGANGTIICSGAPMAVLAPAPAGQAGVGSSSQALTGGAGLVPNTTYGYDEWGDPVPHDYQTPGEMGGMNNSEGGGGE